MPLQVTDISVQARNSGGVLCRAQSPTSGLMSVSDAFGQINSACSLFNHPPTGLYQVP